MSCQTTCCRQCQNHVIHDKCSVSDDIHACEARPMSLDCRECMDKNIPCVHFKKAEEKP